MVADRFARFRGERVAFVCNQASVDADFRHLIDLAQEAGVEIACAFGPQHGIWGHTQDNMVEWEGYEDPRTGLRFYSLYGEHRSPTEESLKGVDRLVFDVPDVGARYYTFIWTLANCMSACTQNQVQVTVLDRPNPINGTDVEGPVMQPAFASFVGLYPLPARHGMTVGEVGNYLQRDHIQGCDYSVVELTGWQRDMFFQGIGLPWVAPSPNMPTADTALVYPGMCLLEGTNLSEGRGTTRPFETFGAPWLDGRELSKRLNDLALPGVSFRPTTFEPTFQKHAGKVCEGCFIHVRDRKAFHPVLTAIAVITASREMGNGKFEWRQPPYEYEYERLPFDILAGNDWLRQAIEQSTMLDSFQARLADEVSAFEGARKSSLIY